MKKIYGVGINDADYVINRKGGYRCPFYNTWTNMLARCYSKFYQKNNPSYDGCDVCDHWKKFSNFKKWMELQNWKGNELDKDILVPGNKTYCQDRCIFIPSYINCLFVKGGNKNKSSDLPVGVGWHKKAEKYRSYFRKNKKNIHLGLFDTVEDAHREYLKYKKEYILEIAEHLDDDRLKKRLIEASQII